VGKDRARGSLTGALCNRFTLVPIMPAAMGVTFYMLFVKTTFLQVVRK
jgi:hypothetical protein